MTIKTLQTGLTRLRKEAFVDTSRIGLYGFSRGALAASLLAVIPDIDAKVVIVCSALLLAVYTIVHTHRLMGSAYRIGVCLREINSGQPTRIHLRDGDFFLEIADEINVLADKAVDTDGGSSKEKEDPDSKKEGDEASNSEQPA